jgi:choline dehydrogenase-like flavoprotein
MIRDLRISHETHDIEADVCVIGAGAAGITLALALTETPLEICVLESGGQRPDPATRGLLTAESIGLPYDAERSRLRYFGGSTNVGGWGGWCKPLEPIDLRRRSWIAGSGWPFGREELDPYYRRAHEICEVGPFDYDVESWSEHLGSRFEPLPLASGRVETQLAQLGPPTRFAKEYRGALERAGNVTVLLNANVIEILTTPDMSEATGVEIAAFDGIRRRVRATTVVLAAGGIENARLLLLSGPANAPGLGNENDLVGRNFCDHPRLDVGTVELKESGRLLNLYDGYYKVRHRKRSLAGVYDQDLVAGALALTEGFQEHAGVLNFRAWIIPKWTGGDTEEVEALKRLYVSGREHDLPLRSTASDVASVLRHPVHVGEWVYGRAFRPKRFVRSFELVNILEPEPMPDSRVMLSDQVDALGARRARIEWKVGRLVRRTLARAHEALDEELRSSGIGRVVDPFREGDEQRFLSSLGFVWHHMGTTRMDVDPTQGVVDANARLHSASNVYVAGSSVFPTPGNDMPTLTIVALALRLADHLKTELGVAERSTPEPTTDGQLQPSMR